jgi:hypothetical protein
MYSLYSDRIRIVPDPPVNLPGPNRNLMLPESRLLIFSRLTAVVVVQQGPTDVVGRVVQWPQPQDHRRVVFQRFLEFQHTGRHLPVFSQCLRNI